MTRRCRFFIAVSCLAAISGGLAVAWQSPFDGGGAFPMRQWPPRPFGFDGLPSDRAGVPDWKNDDRYKRDVFTFVRVEYDSYRGGGWGRGGGWRTDFPDSDLNFSYRLQQLTVLKVNPEPIIRRLTAADVFDYPFLYMIEPGRLLFSEEEVVALRRYLLNGGFLMVDDFWGDSEYQNFYREIKRVFPEREPEELPLDHEIFRCVYKLQAKPQVPSMHSFQESYDPEVTWEWGHDGNVREVHYRGISDVKGRLMVIICHNTDLGDGWEREGQDHEYFKEFSVKKAYPMGINIVTYAMTH